MRRALAALLLVVLMAWPTSAQAAQVLQVRSSTLLQVGDGNRSSPVRLACLSVAAEREQQATDWLRKRLPRRSRVNLLPAGQDHGVLLARVVRLEGSLDLAAGLVEAGLAEPGSDCIA